MNSLKQKQRLMIILNDQSHEKTSIKQSNITARTSTNIGTNKQNLEELKKQTLLNILSVKGFIYTYYKNNGSKMNTMSVISKECTNSGELF